MENGNFTPNESNIRDSWHAHVYTTPTEDSAPLIDMQFYPLMRQAELLVYGWFLANSSLLYTRTCVPPEQRALKPEGITPCIDETGSGTKDMSGLPPPPRSTALGARPPGGCDW